MKKSDPFETEPLPKAFYYPSREKELSKKEKKVCLSAPYSSQDTQHQVSSPEDLKFLKETNTLQTEVPTRENGSTADLSSTSPFNESWPSTERTGSFGTPLSDGTVSTPEMSQQMREWLEGQEKPAGNSTLGWYINRFRNAPPTDRQHRDKKSFVSKNKPNFWWLSPPSGLSTPSEQSTPVPGHTPPQKLPPSPKKTPSPITKKGKPTSSIPSPSSHLDDRTTAELDRRAKELLEKSETSIDTSSTEPFPLPLKKPAEYKPTQPKAGPKDYKTSPQKTMTPILERPASSHQNPWPEDDILYQWRLARKMEKAQEKVSRPGVRVPLKKADPYGIRKPVDTHRILSQPLNIPHAPDLSTYDDVLPGPSGISTLPGITTPDTTPRTLSSTAVQTPSVTTTTAVSGNMGDTIRGSQTPVSMVTSYCTGTRPIVTPVLSRPCRHLESSSRNEGGESSHEDKLQPHMHLACDILPCQCIGNTQMNYHHQQHPHEIHYKETKDRVSAKEMRSDITDNVQLTDEEKENEIPQCKKSHFKPDLSTISESKKQANKQSHQEKKRKTSSSFESLSSSTETESEKETRQLKRKEKMKQVEHKGKSKENRTSEMVRNVIGEVISEHMFSGQSSTGDTEMKATDDSGTDDKKSNKSTFTQEQGNLLAESSDEEFPDDEILKILRQRSKDLKKELQRIDSLLDQDP